MAKLKHFSWAEALTIGGVTVPSLKWHLSLPHSA